MIGLLLAASTIFQDFQHGDVYRRLVGLRQEVTQGLDLGGGELIVVDYVPHQGSLSEWDDESRLVLYRRTPGGGFDRVQWVSRAGKSVPGRLARLEAVDLDGDGTPEVLAQGRPHAPSMKTTTLIFRRPHLGAKFELAWTRKDAGATLVVGPPGQGFTYRGQRLRLVHGQIGP